MQWKSALEDVETVESADADVGITSIAYDSRQVRAGSAFVAMQGGTTDGNRYIDVALSSGASAIVTDSADVYKRLRSEHPRLAIAQVRHGRRALAGLSASILGHPESKLAVSAVTGTNGKTTTAFLLEQLLRAAHRKCVLLGTIETHIADEVRESPHTTPEAADILQIFADGVAAGATEAVMEMSSHALDQERVWGIPVDVAIFTNLTQDHLDYHGTMARYAAAKARLFQGVGTPPPRVAVINADDPFSAELCRSLRGSELISYGIEQAHASHSALHIRQTPYGTLFDFDTPEDRVPIESPFYGRINISNLLAAMSAALARGMSLDEIRAAAGRLRPAPGRFELVPQSKHVGFSVIVDYAHTEDALRNLLSVARELVKDRAGRIITVFGCGGDRDRTKRPRMGRAAAEGSDVVVLTSDNPRSEDPLAIIDEILSGTYECSTRSIVEPNRAAAIETAIKAAQPGDIVLIAGKGHEKVQVLAHRMVPFDDVEIATSALNQLGEVEK